MKELAFFLEINEFLIILAGEILSNCVSVCFGLWEWELFWLDGCLWILEPNQAYS